MTITSEIQLLSPSALIELFVLDMTSVNAGIAYFHAGSNGLQQPLVWQGQTYVALPIEAEGFEMTTYGTLPRPKIRVANINGMFSGEVAVNDDLIGCKVTRLRTYARFLDAVKFPGGANPAADPNQSLPSDMWFVEQKMTETRYMIEWELSSAFDLIGVQLPGRQVIQNTCMSIYRGPDCGWTGGCYDINDLACAPVNDCCAKRLTSCQVRWGVSVALPYGGFPGATADGS